jgi:hypothetical protein
MFSNRKAIFATKHSKEKVVSPIFAKELNIKIEVSKEYDTDLFGTFSGEIDRKDTALITCILKAKDAAKTLGYDLAIASEGSFGPHPSFYFVPGNIEFMCLVDLKNKIEIVESILSDKTNYKHFDFSKDHSYSNFLEDIYFPSHSLILRDLTTGSIIEKAIDDFEQLNDLISDSFKLSTRLRLETDMRAMCNPMRMQVISEVAHKLVQRIKRHCSECNTPGFGLVRTEGELLCEFCQMPTKSYKHITHNCIKCDYKEILPREDGLTVVSMQHCQFCNP